MMSRRPSERKAKTAASHFLKRVTGADDSTESQSLVSQKRKLLKVTDNQPVAKKSKSSAKEVQQSANLKSVKLEPNEKVDKRLKTGAQVKPLGASACAIATRSSNSQNAMNKSGLLLSATAKPVRKKESSKMDAVLMGDLGPDNVKCEPSVDESESVEKMGIENKFMESVVADENAKQSCDDVEHVPSTVESDEVSAADTLPPTSERTESESCAVASLVCAKITDELQFASIESNVGAKDIHLKMAHDIEHVLCNNNQSHDSGVNTLSCSPTACESTQMALDGSPKADVCKTRIDNSAFGNIWECKNLISGPFPITPDDRSIISIGNPLPEVLLHEQSSESTSDMAINYPTISISNFLAISGLISKSELPSPSAALANRLHREAGGKLRRCIKTYRKPQMMYRRVNSAGFDSVAKLNSVVTASILNSERGSTKVNELKRMQANKSRIMQFPVKKDAGASPVKSSDVKITEAEIHRDSTTGFADDVQRKVDDSKTPAVNSFSSADKNDFKKPKPVTKGDQPPEDLMPSRRSARQSGTQRKEWRHLLRANPDEHEAKSQESGSDIARSVNQKAKPAPSDASPVKRTTAASTKNNGENGTSSKNDKNEMPSARQSDSKPASKAPLAKSKSLPATSISKKPVIVHENRSCSPVDLCDTRDEIPDRIGNWDILKYRYKEMECVTPHMCTVCWVNDHMYCKNMKRTSSDLPHFLPCIHYIACSHFRSFNPLYDASAFRSLGLSDPGCYPACTKSFRWNTSELICLDESGPPPQKIISEDDLLCNEVMLESDAESSNHSADGTELLQIQLKARTAQIFQSLGVDELPHGKSPPLDVRLEKAPDPADDDGGDVDVVEFAAEVMVYNGDDVMEVDESNVHFIEDLKDLCMVGYDNSCDLSGIEFDEREHVSRPAEIVKQCKSSTLSQVAGQKKKDCEISHQSTLKSSKSDKLKSRTIVSTGSKSKQTHRSSVDAAEMKKCTTKNKDKSVYSNAMRTELEQRREKLVCLLQTTDSDLSEFQVAIEQQKRRHSMLTFDVSKMTEQLTLKRAQVLAYDKEKQDLKRRFESLQSQLSDMKQTASRHRNFVGLFDKFLPWSQVSAGKTNVSVSSSLTSFHVQPSIALQVLRATNEPHIEADLASRSTPDANVLSKVKTPVFVNSENASSLLSRSTFRGTPVELGTTAKRCSNPEQPLRTVVTPQSEYKVPSSCASDSLNTVTIFLPQPIMSRSVLSVAPSVRLVVSTGWQMPVTCGTQMRTTQPVSLVNELSVPGRGVVLNSPRLVRHFSLPAKHQLKSLAVVPTPSVEQHSSSRCVSQPLQVSSVSKFVPVIRVSPSTTSLAENQIEIVSDDDSEPELCFYGYKNRSLGHQAQVTSLPLPDLLTPDPSCSSQESKASMDY